jgi:Zn-finger in ubiquitin-hydrolases and other protein
MVLCRHRDHIQIPDLPQHVDGCEDCLAAGQQWLHLRICLECGHVGCCDDSPHQHATAHANATGHPIIRSLEPGEEWAWCYIDRIGMLTPEVAGSTRIPVAAGSVTATTEEGEQQRGPRAIAGVSETRWR